MGRRSGGRGRGGQPPIKGFRPGKEPGHLKKQRAKSQLPSDASWAQKQAVEAVAGRSPAEVRAMVRTWVVVLLVATAALAVAGVFLYSWAVWAGALVHVLAAGALFLALRLRKQSQVLEEMAKQLR